MQSNSNIVSIINKSDIEHLVDNYRSNSNIIIDDICQFAVMNVLDPNIDAIHLLREMCTNTTFLKKYTRNDIITLAYHVVYFPDIMKIIVDEFKLDKLHINGIINDTKTYEIDFFQTLSNIMSLEKYMEYIEFDTKMSVGSICNVILQLFKKNKLTNITPWMLWLYNTKYFKHLNNNEEYTLFVVMSIFPSQMVTIYDLVKPKHKIEINKIVAIVVKEFGIESLNDEIITIMDAISLLPNRAKYFEAENI